MTEDCWRAPIQIFAESPVPRRAGTTGRRVNGALFVAPAPLEAIREIRPNYARPSTPSSRMTILMGSARSVFALGFAGRRVQLPWTRQSRLHRSAAVLGAEAPIRVRGVSPAMRCGHAHMDIGREALGSGYHKRSLVWLGKPLRRQLGCSLRVLRNQSRVLHCWTCC